MPNIAVIGDIILDHYFIGDANRISPEAPIPIVKIQDEHFLLGGACNVVRNLKSFESNVYLFGIVGDDNNGSKVVELINQINVSSEFILKIKDRPTTFKSRVQAGNQQIVRLDKEDESEISRNIENELLNLFCEIINKIDLVIISDYAKGLLTNSFLKQIINICNRVGIKILVDPKGKDFTKYKGTFLSTPNKLEATIATNVNIIDKESLYLAMNKLKEFFDSENQIITLGSEGIAYCDSKEIQVFPALASEVYDVTGAGDTVIAALGYKIAKGYSIKDSIEFANKAASIVVQKRGPAVATLNEIENLSGRISKKNTIFYNSSEIKEDFLSLISKSKIVFTSGCFDIIHSGNISFLQKASELGDLLIVGLNSNESIKKTKGSNSPIIDEKDRAIVLAALSFVDYVIVFDDSSPNELIKLLKPTILVKSGKAKASEVVGDFITNKTIVLPIEESKVTTEFISKIKIDS